MIILPACTPGVKHKMKSQKQRISAIIILAVPVVQYSLNTFKCVIAVIKLMDVKSRNFLIFPNIYHPKVDADRLCLSRSEEGRGFLQLELS